MKTISKKLELSIVLQGLSRMLLDLGAYLLKKSKKGLKAVGNYISFQVEFLRDFEYTKVNIVNHFLEKAAAFFDFDVDETKQKIKRMVTTKKRKVMKRGVQPIQKRGMKKQDGWFKFSIDRSDKRKNKRKFQKNKFIPIA